MASEHISFSSGGRQLETTALRERLWIRTETYYKEGHTNRVGGCMGGLVDGNADLFVHVHLVYNSKSC